MTDTKKVIGSLTNHAVPPSLSVIVISAINHRKRKKTREQKETIKMINSCFIIGFISSLILTNCIAYLPKENKNFLMGVRKNTQQYAPANAIFHFAFFKAKHFFLRSIEQVLNRKDTR